MITQAIYHNRQSTDVDIRGMRKISKFGKKEENRKVTWEMLLQRHKRESFLYRIVAFTWQNPSFNGKAKSLRQEYHVEPERNL